MSELTTAAKPSTGGTDGINYSDLNVGPPSRLVSFDMRNGAVNEARSLLKPTIGVAWHWRPIENLPSTLAIANASAFIRQQIAHMSIHAPPMMNDVARRKVAIIVAVARAVTTEFYRIQPQDLIPGETLPPWLRYIEPVPPATVGTVQAISTLPANVKAALAQAIELSDDERNAIDAIHMSAIGMLPLQGYSLAICGHHYLSETTTQSRQAYDVVEKRHWSSKLVFDWFNNDLHAIRDAMWHKSGHPIHMTLKHKVAFSWDIAKKLTKAGAGAATSRFPMISNAGPEPELRAANSYTWQIKKTLTAPYNDKESNTKCSLKINKIIK